MDVMCLCTYKVIILEYTQTGVLLSSWLYTVKTILGLGCLSCISVTKECQ